MSSNYELVLKEWHRTFENLVKARIRIEESVHFPLNTDARKISICNHELALMAYSEATAVVDAGQLSK